MQPSIYNILTSRLTCFCDAKAAIFCRTAAHSVNPERIKKYVNRDSYALLQLSLANMHCNWWYRKCATALAFLNGIMQRGHSVGIAEGEHSPTLTQGLADVWPVTDRRPR